jgi:hypothetical protein
VRRLAVIPLLAVSAALLTGPGLAVASATQDTPAAAHSAAKKKRPHCRNGRRAVRRHGRWRCARRIATRQPGSGAPAPNPAPAAPALSTPVTAGQTPPARYLVDAVTPANPNVQIVETVTNPIDTGGGGTVSVGCINELWAYYWYGWVSRNVFTDCSPGVAQQAWTAWEPAPLSWQYQFGAQQLMVYEGYIY